MGKRLLIFWLSIFLGALYLPTIAGNYSIAHYNDENGLPQNSIKAILEDPNGFVWFTTESGLVRFDGRTFKAYDKSNTIVHSSRFSFMQPAPNGKRGGFYAVTDELESLLIENGRARSDAVLPLTDIFGAPYMSSLIKTANFQSATDIIYAGLPFSGFHWARQYIVISRKTNAVSFVMQANQVCFYEKGKFKKLIIYPKYELKEMFSLNDELYHCPSNGTFLRLTTAGAKPCKLLGDLLQNKRFRSGIKNFKIYSNHLSDQSFIVLDKSLYSLIPDTNGNLKTRLLLDDFDFEGQQIINVLQVTSTGRLFFGSLSKGLFVLSPKKFAPVRIKSGNQENITYAQVATSGGLALVTGERILKLSSDTLLAASSRNEWLNKKKQNLNQISMAIDSLGRFWTSSGSYVICYDQTGKTVIGSWNISNLITTMRLGPDGTLWMGTREKGVWYKNVYETSAYPRLFLNKGFAKITNILSRGRQVYIGTDRGLYIADAYSRSYKIMPGTEQLTIRGLHDSPDEKEQYLFISTYGDGIFLYHNGRLTNFPIDAKKSLQFAHCFIEDRAGFMWITTNTGLVQASKADLIAYARKSGRINPYYLHYNKRDGFGSNEFNGGCVPCAVTLSDKTVSMPSMDGLVWFKPESVKAEVPDKGLFLDEVKVFNKNVTVNADTVNLPNEPQQVTIAINTPYFGDAINLNMSYALTRPGENPLDSAWISINPENPTITFSELRSGSHTLHVKKVNGYDSNNFMVRKIVVNVPPKWHETTWFYLGCALMGIGVGGSYGKMRSAFLRRENVVLERKVNLRTSNLKGALVALQRSQEKMSRQAIIQTRLIASISHDIRNPLHYLGMLVSTIERLANAKNTDKIIEISRDLGTSTERISKLLDNHLQYAKSLVYQNFDMDATPVLPLVKEKIDLFLPYLKQRGNRILEQVPEDFTVYSDIDLLKVILHNLIDNANKYTSDGIILVFAEKSPAGMQISVQDDGQGLPDDILNWINEDDSGLGDEIIRQKTEFNGLGMVIIKDLARILHIKLSASNEHGARITLSFRNTV